MLRILATVLFVLSLAARAEEAPPEPVPDQPEVPSPVVSGEPMEPDVTVIQKGDERIEEYRMNNRLYRVKVTPVIGPSYYLDDTDGDGNVDVRRSDNETGLQINKWMLFSW